MLCNEVSGLVLSLNRHTDSITYVDIKTRRIFLHRTTVHSIWIKTAVSFMFIEHPSILDLSQKIKLVDDNHTEYNCFSKFDSKQVPRCLVSNQIISNNIKYKGVLLQVLSLLNPLQTHLGFPYEVGIGEKVQLAFRSTGFALLLNWLASKVREPSSSSQQLTNQTYKFIRLQRFLYTFVF